MHHAFASAFLINNFDFTKTLSTESPQQRWQDITPKDFLVNEEDLRNIKENYVCTMAKVASRFIPGLSFMSECLPQMQLGEHSQFLKEKTAVVPLETLPYNEQKYDEVVKVLESYEKTLKKVHDQAGEILEDTDSFHTGGDQLTRERFSGAKRLRAAEVDPADKFHHLHPITFEFFHLLMNFLKVYIHFLYSEESVKDVGTMKCEINRIKRSNFDKNVNDAYDADRDFVSSFTDAYIVELFLEFFGMESLYSQPNKNVPPEFSSDDETRQWIYSTIGKMLDETLFEQNSSQQKYATSEEVIGNTSRESNAFAILIKE